MLLEVVTVSSVGMWKPSSLAWTKRYVHRWLESWWQTTGTSSEVSILIMHWWDWQQLIPPDKVGHEGPQHLTPDACKEVQ